jgi:hypothetical protein
LAVPEILHEVLHLISLDVAQIVALREELINVEAVLPHQVLHVVRQPDLGSQALSPLKVVQVLTQTEVGDAEAVLALRAVQQVEGIRLELRLLISTLFVLIRGELMLHPALAPSQEVLPQVIIVP